MLAASIVTSTREAATFCSSRWKVPLSLLNCPLTVEIIMCLTANSTCACAVSISQAIVCAPLGPGLTPGLLLAGGRADNRSPRPMLHNRYQLHVLKRY